MIYKRTARRGWIAVYAARPGEARWPFPSYRKHDEDVDLERGLASKIRDMVVDRGTWYLWSEVWKKSRDSVRRSRRDRASRPGGLQTIRRLHVFAPGYREDRGEEREGPRCRVRRRVEARARRQKVRVHAASRQAPVRGAGRWRMDAVALR